MCLVPGEARKTHWHHGNWCCRGLKPPGLGARNPNLGPLQEQSHWKIFLFKVSVLWLFGRDYEGVERHNKKNMVQEAVGILRSEKRERDRWGRERKVGRIVSPNALQIYVSSDLCFILCPSSYVHDFPTVPPAFNFWVFLGGDWEKNKTAKTKPPKIKHIHSQSNIYDFEASLVYIVT